jgi:hypothetical protein
MLRLVVLVAALFAAVPSAVAGGPHCGPGYCFDGDTCTPCGVPR